MSVPQRPSAPVPVSGIAYFIQSRKKDGIQREVALCLLKSVDIGTLCAYLRAWKKFAYWCNSKSIGPSDFSINHVCTFLNDLFNDNYSTSALNVTRSSLSFFINYLNIGSNDNVTKLFKYFWRTRPTFPRYLVTWNLDTLLSLLQKWHPPNVLSLEQLTMKTIALTAVFSSDRGQTLESIDIEHSHQTDEAIMFPIYSLLKTSKKRRPVNVVKCYKSDDPSLNVADYVMFYLNTTFKFRLRAVSKGLPKPRQLFLSAFTGKPMRRATIAKYLLKAMSIAGIDTNTFKAHSARAVFPSRLYRKGASTHKILSQGNWKNFSTFNKFYNREAEDSPEGQLILEVTNKKRH